MIKSIEKFFLELFNNSELLRKFIELKDEDEIYEFCI